MDSYIYMVKMITKQGCIVNVSEKEVRKKK